MKIIAQRSKDTQWGLHPNLDASGRTLAKMTAEVILKERMRSDGKDNMGRTLHTEPFQGKEVSFSRLRTACQGQESNVP